jgi:hypothetical protein
VSKPGRINNHSTEICSGSEETCIPSTYTFELLNSKLESNEEEEGERKEKLW